MSDKLTNHEQDHPVSKAKRRTGPVVAKNRLYISEESAAHVANVQGSTDTDRHSKIRVIDSHAPTDEAPDKSVGTATSNP